MIDPSKGSRMWAQGWAEMLGQLVGRWAASQISMKPGLSLEYLRSECVGLFLCGAVLVWAKGPLCTGIGLILRRTEWIKTGCRYHTIKLHTQDSAPASTTT